MGFLKSIIAGIGVEGGLLLLGLVLPVLLGFIKVGEYGSALDKITEGAGVTVSLFLQTKLGNKVEGIIEFFIISIVCNLLIYPILGFIKGMRKDDKLTLVDNIAAIKAEFTKMLKKTK